MAAEADFVVTDLDSSFVVSEGIEVVESTTTVCPAVEEAAVLYANDRMDDAIAGLVRALKEDCATSCELQAWLMLFDLYQVQGSKQYFEDLSLEFVNKFERSPPAWVEPEQSAPAPRAAVKTGEGDYVALAGIISSDMAAEIKQMCQAAEKMGSLRLDLSKIQGIEASGSKLLLESLQSFRKTKLKVQYGGTGNLMGLLKQAIKGELVADANYHWLLLLELYQILGMYDEFEELAIEYAVTLEVSPPSWEQRNEKVELVEEAPDETGAESPIEETDTFVMEGVMSGNADDMLKGLVEHAASRNEVYVDMGRVPRVDFVSVGTFLNTLIELSTKGKIVYIKEANEMLLALFSVMGVNQFVTLIRKKGH